MVFLPFRNLSNRGSLFATGLCGVLVYAYYKLDEVQKSRPNPERFRKVKDEERLNGYVKAQTQSNQVLLLVTAHPDDESMFFVPTLRAFEPKNIFILCLSTGNADGLGSIRTAELHMCCSSQFGIPKENIVIIDNDKLQDGKNQSWSLSLVSEMVKETFLKIREKYEKTTRISVVTFDEYGVSSHPNHIATHLGVKQFSNNLCWSDNVQVYKLLTTSWITKFIGPLSLLWRKINVEEGLAYVNDDLAKSFRLMACHASQFVWYRRLFIVFSRYTFVNDLVPI